MAVPLVLMRSARRFLYYSGFQQVVRGPPVVPEGVPGGPQLNDGELVIKEPLQILPLRVRLVSFYTLRS